MQRQARKYSLDPAQNVSVVMATRMHVVRSVVLAAAATSAYFSSAVAGRRLLSQRFMAF
jgi:hypothetical protein